MFLTFIRILQILIYLADDILHIYISVLLTPFTFSLNANNFILVNEVINYIVLRRDHVCKVISNIFLYHVRIAVIIKTYPRELVPYL